MSNVKFKTSGVGQIKTVVRTLHFERCNPHNVHENASAFANNIANRVLKDRESRN